MTEWIDVKDRLPTEEGPIIVLIGDRMFFGEAYIAGKFLNTIFVHKNEWILFEIPRVSRMFMGDIPITTGSNDWKMAAWFKKPSHWMPLPKPPINPEKE